MKKILFLGIIIFSSKFSFSQSFMHGVGFMSFIESVPGSSIVGSGGLTYSPRFNFVEMGNSSFSIGVPLSIGFSGSANYSTNGESGNSLKFVFDVPLIMNYNFGRGSTKETESKFGFFVGAGYGYHYGTANTNFDDGYGIPDAEETSVKSNGPVGNAGVRIGVGRGTHNIEIRASYMKGIDASKANIFGIGALFNF